MADEPVAIAYRPARPTEEAALIDLWVAANPDSDPAAWRREYERAPDRFVHTLVAAAPTGGLLAAALWWPRLVRDAAGEARLVGNVSHVATRPEAWRCGHATRLMALAIDAMRAEGCAWATLTTSEEARPLYQRLGWRAYPRLSWQGRLVRRPAYPPSTTWRPMNQMTRRRDGC